MKKAGLAGGLAVVLLLFSACGDNLDITISTVSEVIEEEVVLQAPEIPESAESVPVVLENEIADEYEFSEEETGTVEIIISAAGDVTMGNYFGQDIAGSFQESWSTKQDAAYYLENVYEIFSLDDMTLVNLEGPLTNAEKRQEDKTYCIKGDPAYAKILTAGSVEAVGLANNHSMDYFRQGLEDTMRAVSDEGIVYAYDNQVALYEAKGIRIGLISLNILRYGSGVEKQLEEGISALREQEADLMIVTCHWGIERENYPEEYQMKLGRKCIDQGADLVLGHHPHVIQGIEEYQGKYIVYSLGNFCFGANRNPADKDCIIFQQSFLFEENGRLGETKARIIPCCISSVKHRNDYKPTPSTGEEYTGILERMRTYSQPFELEFGEDGVIQ